jgi:hypothetical protein
MVKKIGFICEGESEKAIVESLQFQNLLLEYGFECVKIIDAAGNGNLLPKNLSNHMDTMIRYNAEVILILTDLDEDACITITKERIKNLSKNVEIIVAVKALESWYLADSLTLSKIFQKNYSFPKPEETIDSPYKILKSEFATHHPRKRGFGSKNLLAQLMLNNGYSIKNSAEHPYCPSAKYLISTLQSLKPVS